MLGLVCVWKYRGEIVVSCRDNRLVCVGDVAFVETSGKRCGRTVDHLTKRKQQFRASLEVFPGLPDRASSRMSEGGVWRNKTHILVCMLCSINR